MTFWRTTLAFLLVTLAMLVLLLRPACSAEPGKPVLLCFSMRSCPECPAMYPIWQKFATTGYTVHRLDADQQPDYFAQLNVKQVPMTVIAVTMPDGKLRETGRILGVTNQQKITELLRRAQ